MTRLGNAAKLSAFDLCCQEDESLNADTRRSGEAAASTLWHCAKRTASQVPLWRRTRSLNPKVSAGVP